MPRELFYDLLAPFYGRFFSPLFKLAAARAVERISAGSPRSVLEVAVGPGISLVELSKRSGGQITGVDISQGMLTRAREHLADMEARGDLVRADALALPFSDEAFDGVVSTLFLNLLPGEKLRRAFDEMSRVLALGGRLVIGILNPSHDLLRRSWTGAYKLLPDLVGHLRPVDPASLLEGSGLRVIRDETVAGTVDSRVMTLVKSEG